MATIAIDGSEFMAAARTAKEAKATTITPVFGLAISIISVVSGLLGGFVGAVGTASQWKGEIQTRIEVLEKRIAEDRMEYKQDREYYRTQNEIIGKQLAAILATLDAKPPVDAKGNRR